ncbi:uncharacterized protein lrif1 [Pungitius pungitius]|uniref:uncharacterized protein lrif1 n=1 Tax=Pungitius pungitius TaxID=134920 RepID=UPI002E10CB5D
MYPVTKRKEPLHSGTGVFYQAIPAVGADGRNIMKLIPVQMVNGHVLKSQISQLKTEDTHPKALSWNIASAPVVIVKKTAVPSTTERIVSEQVSLMGSASYQVGLDTDNLLDKQPRQQLQQSVKTLAVLPSKASPAQSGNSVRPASQFSVTVKSPAHPRSRGTEVLSTAQVPTVPASNLPAGIWNQTYTSSANCCPSSDLPSSPITSMDGAVTPQRDSALYALKSLCKITNITSCVPSSKGSKSHFNSIPNVPKRPNSLIKWSVEEDNSSTAPTSNPIDSSITAKILRVLAERENTKKHFEVTKSITESVQVSGEEQANVIDRCNRKQPGQQQSVHLMSVVPLRATPVANGGNTGKPLNDLHFPLTSPAPPSGHWHPNTPMAQLQTLPTSERPAGIKKKTFTQSAVSCLSSACAVYMPLITSMNRGVAPRDSTHDMLKWFCKTENITSYGPPSKDPEPNLKLIPKVPKWPNSPIQWSVEEDNSTAPNLVPFDSSVTNAGKLCEVVGNRVCGPCQGKSGQRRENSLVLCDGKLFWGAKNRRLPHENGKIDTTIAAGNCYESDKAIVASTQQSLPPLEKQGYGILKPDAWRQVIDLCDDDAPNDPFQPAARMPAVTVDEDNVIFVSYTPPKSDSQDLRQKLQMVQIEETDQMASSNVTKQESLHSTHSALRGEELGHTMSVNDSRQTTSAQQMEQVYPSNNATRFRMDRDPHSVETSMSCGKYGLEPESCERTDELLRRISGITADVRICLQRIDEASAGSLPAELPKSECIRLVQDHKDTTSRFEESDSLLQHFNSQQGTESCNGRKVESGNVLSTPDLSKGSSTAIPHSDAGPPDCSHLEVNTNPSPEGRCADVELEPMIGYVEPIDEDFLSADENDFSYSRNTAGRPQTCADLNANTRRHGRKRKRPTCPCCIAGTQDPTARFSAKSEEPEKWVGTMEKTGKKGARAKALGKDLNISGGVTCLTVKDKHSCRPPEEAAGDRLTLTATDSDEVQLHEQITRLRELLQEKEAALELKRTIQHFKQ